MPDWLHGFIAMKINVSIFHGKQKTQNHRDNLMTPFLVLLHQWKYQKWHAARGWFPSKVKKWRRFLPTHWEQYLAYPVKLWTEPCGLSGWTSTALRLKAPSISRLDLFFGSPKIITVGDYVGDILAANPTQGLVKPLAHANKIRDLEVHQADLT